MRRGFDGKCWKSVQVLAGSIVEALLIDYLAATPNAARSSKDPHRMDLSEAIEMCLAEGLLDQRSADLSSVVRSYRNLIHPGRVVRLSEDQPSEASAGIAFNLVSIITAKVEARRRATFGLTAEQLLSKLERDPDSLAILSHLLIGVDSAHRKRLLLDMLPRRYLEIAELTKDDEEPTDLWVTGSRIEKAFHTAFNGAETTLKELVARRFVQILREEDGLTITRYRDAFFKPAHLAYVSDMDKALVKEHFLAMTDEPANWGSAERLRDITPYLNPDDVPRWADAYIRTLSSGTAQAYVMKKVKDDFLNGMIGLSSDSQAVLMHRLDRWIENAKKRNQASTLSRLEELRTDVVSRKELF